MQRLPRLIERLIDFDTDIAVGYGEPEHFAHLGEIAEPRREWNLVAIVIVGQFEAQEGKTFLAGYGCGAARFDANVGNGRMRGWMRRQDAELQGASGMRFGRAEDLEGERIGRDVDHAQNTCERCEGGEIMPYGNDAIAQAQ